MSRLPRQPAGNDDLKFPNPFQDEAPPVKRVRGSLPILPSVGLGPDEPKEAQDPAWDPLKSKRDDQGLPDKPLTWRRRLMWPGFAVCCGLMLIASAYFIIDSDDSGDGGADERLVIYDGFGTSFPTPIATPNPYLSRIYLN